MKFFSILFLFCVFSLPAQEVVDAVDKFPEFPGGDKALNKYFKKNIVNPPAMAKDKEFMGCKCDIKVIINELGKAISPRIVHSCEHWFGSDKEVLRLINDMPAWKPAILQNKAVAHYQTITIYFNKP